MSNGGDSKEQWKPLAWCRACGSSYKRFVGGLKKCCPQCSDCVRRIEVALAKELNESMKKVLNNVTKKEGESE